MHTTETAYGKPASGRVTATHILLILAATAAVYSNALGNGFVTDDFGLLADNPNVKDWGRLSRIFTTGYWDAEGWTGGLYRPLTILSFLVEYTLAGSSPFIYHIDNVILHFLCCLLVYLLVRKIYDNPWVSLFTALLFAAHPVHAEAVAWISGRSELLWSVFGLSSILLFMRRADVRWAGPLSVVCYLAAIFSKESAVVVPALLAVFLLIFVPPGPGESRARQVARTLWPYIAATALFITVKLLVLGRLGPAPGDQALVTMAPADRLLIMCRVLFEYIRMGFFPTGLSNDYLFPPPGSVLDVRVLTPIAIAAAAAALSPLIIKRSKPAFFAVAWFFVGLLPVSNILPTGVIMSDRAMYVPALGICMLAGAAFSAAYRPAKVRAGKAMLGFILFLPMLGSFAALTADRNHLWKDQDSLSTAYIRRLNEAVALYPDYTPLYRMLARMHFRFRPYGPETEKAVLEAYKRAGPDDPEMREMMSRVYEKRGVPEAALDEITAAIDMAPDKAKYRYTAARLLASMKRYEEADNMVDTAIGLNPNKAEYYMLKADTMMETGEDGPAYTVLERVTELDPENYDAYLRQGIILNSQLRFGEAIEKIRHAVALRPDIPDLHYFMAVAYLDAGFPGRAAVELDEAIRLRPGYREAVELRGRLGRE